MKSIGEELEEIAEKMCDTYCKYPEKWDPETEGMELYESKICEECPMQRLMG